MATDDRRRPGVALRSRSSCSPLLHTSRLSPASHSQGVALLEKFVLASGSTADDIRVQLVSILASCLHQRANQRIVLEMRRSHDPTDPGFRDAATSKQRHIILRERDELRTAREVRALMVRLLNSGSRNPSLYAEYARILMELASETSNHKYMLKQPYVDQLVLLAGGLGPAVDAQAHALQVSPDWPAAHRSCRRPCCRRPCRRHLCGPNALHYHRLAITTAFRGCACSRRPRVSTPSRTCSPSSRRRSSSSHFSWPRALRRTSRRASRCAGSCARSPRAPRSRCASSRRRRRRRLSRRAAHAPRSSGSATWARPTPRSVAQSTPGLPQSTP